MRVLAILGKLLISLGVGVLLFVGWTLKGTDLYTNRQQDRLAQEFEQLPNLAPVQAEGEERFIGPPEGYAPEPGEPVFRLEIPKVDIDELVVEGVDTESLRMGPGHYPSCRPGFARPLCTDFDEVFPGERGRVIISGHRTTYGAPFWGVDELQKGDEIHVQARWGEFTYTVTEKRIVKPDSLAIAVQSDKAELVLTTCHPRFSAAQRLIVFAELTSTSTPDVAMVGAR
jgi:sortase A